MNGHMEMKKIIKNFGLMVLVTLVGCISSAVAKPIIQELDTVTYQVPLNKSQLIRFSKKIKKISQSNPAIATFKVFPPREFLLKGKSLGTTNIYVWGSNNKLSKIINVEVTHDLETLKRKLNELLPGERIEVRSAQRNIVLSGSVSGLDKMQAAVDIAKSFLPKSKKGSKGNKSSVINLMSISGAHQVMLEIKIAEIDRQIAKGLEVQFNAFRPGDISFGALNGGGSLDHIVTDANAFTNTFDVLSDEGGIAGPIRSLLNHNEHSIDAAGLFFSAVSGSFIYNMTIDAAKNQNLAKILAEPTLTTLSGQEAKFLSGGEFPIPVLQSGNNNNGGITVEFKEFGVGVRFLPVVLDSGRINLNMNVSVSELTDVAAFSSEVSGTTTSFSIPALTKREASSTLELADGQTMSIAGLISDNVRSNVNKFPGLGDIPVLGSLFRSERFVKKQTELVIFVTPRLAKPILADQIVLPTDSFVEPDDLDFYIFGRLEARGADEIVNLKVNDSLKNYQGGLDGQFGHELIEGTK